MPDTILPTASTVSSALRQIIKDYNYWGASESDSPLRISRKKLFTDAQILSADASMRRRIGGTEYEMPADRMIVSKTLLETFNPLVQSSLAAVTGAVGSIEGLRIPVESLEYYVQLYSTFAGLSAARVVCVDAPNDPYVGLFIIGEITTAGVTEFVVAQALLVQT